MNGSCLLEGGHRPTDKQTSRRTPKKVSLAASAALRAPLRPSYYLAPAVVLSFLLSAPRPLAAEADRLTVGLAAAEEETWRRRVKPLSAAAASKEGGWFLIME